MNDIFNFKRFGKYLLTDIKSCFAAYGISFLTIILSGLIIYAVSVIYSLILGNGWHGSGLVLRWIIATISFLVLTITCPSRCYGRITEKRAGSSWLMTPVSIYEKLLSMFLITCIFIPAVFLLAYSGIDFLICMADTTCGEPLVSSLRDLEFLKDGLDELGAGIAGKAVNPLHYIDDMSDGILVFLLGALVFGKGKISKTILSMIAFSIISGIVFTPIALNFAEYGPAMFTDSFLFRNLFIIDTISDITVMAVLIVLIFFRTKTIKH